MITVRTASGADRGDVARVLGTAFRDDPIVRWLLSDVARSDALFDGLARYQHGLGGGTDLALRDGVAVGAALWDPPGYHQSTRNAIASWPSFTRTLRLRTPRALALEAAFARQRPPGEFWYLASVGAAVRGEGVGTALLHHRLDTLDGPAYLESSNEANIGLYERFGFRLLGEYALPLGGPPFWPMFRAAG